MPLVPLQIIFVPHIADLIFFFPSSVELGKDENLIHLKQGAVTLGFMKCCQVHRPNQWGKPEIIFLKFLSP